MVIAGTKKRNKNLDVLKSPCKLAILEYKILLMLRKTKIKSPAITKKTPIKI
jgi:hypothetical protein